MLSLLLPVYNFDIREFVASLYKQALESGVDFEILCFDDHSITSFQELNREVKRFEKVTYKELPENIGRSKIRNLLASKARFDALLLLDCDSKIIDSNFIKNYISHFTAACIVCGGTTYEKEKPLHEASYLRWYYGMKRERVALDRRIKNPYKSFVSNNVLIPKSIFNTIGFNEKIIGYGHEDTLFGNALKEKNIQIKHIENPVIHLGLDAAKVFINKTEEGLKNLKFIMEQQIPLQNVQILKYYSLLKKARLAWLARVLFKTFKNQLYNNLTSQHPRLILFDLYKLGYLFSL
jgi:glycosyltransferase involved in cell wall biosynthesis